MAKTCTKQNHGFDGRKALRVKLLIGNGDRICGSASTWAIFLNIFILCCHRVLHNTKSRAVIGYPSGQDGAILPARDYPLHPASKISPKAI